MGLFNVIAPCAFLVDGKTVHHTRAGAVVEVDDKQAATLVDAGLLEPHEHVHVAVDIGAGKSEPRRGRRGAAESDSEK